MANTILGRVQGAGFFTTTIASGTSVEISTISPNNIKPLVGDSMIFSNGDVRAVTAVNLPVVTCGVVVSSLKGATGQQGANGVNGATGATGATGANGISPIFSYNASTKTLMITSA